MSVRVYVANLLPEDVARIGQALELSGTTAAALGFGAWGVEPTTITTFEDGLNECDLNRFCAALFEEAPDEDALYLSIGGVPTLLYRDQFIQGGIPCTV